MSSLAPIAAAGPRMFCTFRVQDRLYGIDVHMVREVSTHVTMTPVLQAPPIIRGLINLRSRIFLVLDLRAALGFPTTACTADSRLIVLKATVAENVGLLVDRGGEIVNVNEEQIENEPGSDLATAGEARLTPVTGVCKLAAELMMIIDPNRLIEATERTIG